MLTFRNRFFSLRESADKIGDSGLGNLLFFIAGTIGIAIKNGYSYGFPEWNNSQFFINPLPKIENIEYSEFEIPWGFNGFNIPDNSSIFGWLQTEKYFVHSKDLIRYYFTLNNFCEPIKDIIFIHYRDYTGVTHILNQLGADYYYKALELLPEKRVIVLSDNIKYAKNSLGTDFEYLNNLPIFDFYLLTKADYIIMANSSFSWWGAWLSQAETIAPLSWFTPEMNQDTKDIYCDNWKVI
jgi:hypothetical protein